MEKIKVRLYRTEDDNYNELWKEVGGKRFFARHVFGPPVWYYVCDPLGYCELDYPCKENKVFVICDQYGNELFESSNAPDSEPFLTLEQTAKEVWKSCGIEAKKNGLNNWLLSYLTKENLAKDPERTQFCPEDNWVYCWHETVERIPVKKFEYLGSRYCIWKLVQKHLYCDCTWDAYAAASANVDWEYPMYDCWFGEVFEPVYGPMYGKYEAIQMLKKVFSECYGTKNLSIVRDTFAGPHERKLTHAEAAEYLIDKDLSRKHVDELVRREYEKPSFYTNSRAIQKDYPDCKLDYSFRYW